MRIVILTYGTRGDVEPFLALALGLGAAGHDVVLGADVEFQCVIESRNVRYAPLRLNLRKFMQSESGRRAMYGCGDQTAEQRDTFDSMVRPMLDDCWAAVQGADGLIHDTMLFPALHMAEKLGIPSIMASVMPNMTPTWEFSLIGAPRLPFGRLGNRLSYELYRFAWFNASSDIRRWCVETLKMKPPSRFVHYGRRNGKAVPVLYAYSQLVLPSPAEWGEDVLASGYWFLDEVGEGCVQEGLAEFIGAGAPPVSVGFGSMVGLDPGKMTDVVLAAVGKAGVRAVVSTGWGGLVKKAATDVFYVDEVRYDWLFPRMCAVVHHGGSGTTAAGLRFGKPTVICPFVTDQYLWADIVQKGGYGPAPVYRNELTPDRLAESIRRAVDDSGMQRRVAELGCALRAENGVGRAVEFIESRLRAVRDSGFLTARTGG